MVIDYSLAKDKNDFDRIEVINKNQTDKSQVSIRYYIIMLSS